MTAAVTCGYCHRPPQFGDHYPWCKNLVVRQCIICGETDATNGVDRAGRCPACARLTAAEANARVEARRKAMEASLTAEYEMEQTAQRQRKQREQREAEVRLFRSLLDGSPTPLALADGRDTITTVTALVPAGPMTLARITSSTGPAEERRRRRSVMEQAKDHRRDVLTRAQPRLDEIEKEIVPIRQQVAALREQIAAVQQRGQRVVDGFTVHLRTKEEKAADQAELAALSDRLRPALARLAALDGERGALQKEIDTAWDAVETAVADYQRRLDTERDMRLDVLLDGDEGARFHRYCRSCGTPISFLPCPSPKLRPANKWLICRL